MSRRAELTVPWADGDYTFRLPWGQLTTLQEEVGAGPYVVLDRLRDRSAKQKPIEGDDDAQAIDDGVPDDDRPPPPRCSVNEISTTIRLALIGGGLKPSDALRLVRTYVEERVPEENRFLAWAILQIALYGAPEENDTFKKKEPTPEVSD